MYPLIIFCTAATIVSYIVLGYPLLLALIARRFSKPISKAFQNKSVSILIAVHNGEQFIAAKLRSIFELDYPLDMMEVIVVSDGSTDSTVSIVRQWFPMSVRLVEISRGGKCAALNEGIARAINEILVLTDVRQILSKDSLRMIVNNFHDPRVGVVSGALKIRKGRNENESSTGLYWRYESWIREGLSSVDSLFGATGPYYAMRRELAVQLPVDILLDDMYLPLAAFFRGYRLILEPRAEAIDYPTARQVEFRRKVRTLAGNYQILQAYPQLLGLQNRMWFHFMSYKVGRLALPWFFLALLLSSFFLSTPCQWIFLGGQFLFYSLAALDPWVSEGASIKKVSSNIRTFVAMLLAPLCALSVFVVPPRSLWKETKIESSTSEIASA
jgi:cellulose synthase/poly-beta-1,6-N-acetylglucosamine synthase-like glycosyltransferase